MNDIPPLGAPPGILVIDDDPTLPVLLRTVLAQRGFRVWTASSGQTQFADIGGSEALSAAAVLQAPRSAFIDTRVGRW